MTKQYREMINTRRLYRFENDFFSVPKYRWLVKQLPIRTLQQIGHMIWENESPYSRKQLPEIRFGNGMYHTQARGSKYYYSWCDGYTIELAPTQRDLLTLIHEMVHALGYGYHDSQFVNQYIYLLVKYGKMNKKDLITGLQDFKVALPRKYKRLYASYESIGR